MMSTGANVANTSTATSVVPTAENATNQRASVAWKTAPLATTPYARLV